MNRALRSFLVAAALSIAVFAGASPAAVFAAQAATQTAPATVASATVGSTTPVQASAGGPIDVQIWPGQEGQTVVISVVELDANAALPATVRIPVMPGASIQWVGEVLGGNATSDIERPYKLVEGVGGQFVEFTLTKSHRGQLDSIGFPVKVSGDTVSVDVEYVQTVSSAITGLAVRFPPNVSKAKVTPKPSGDPATNELGETLYSIPPKNYKPGEKQKVSASYSTKPPVIAAPGSNATPVLIGLAVALVVAVGALFVVLSRQKSGGEETEDDSENQDTPDTDSGESEPEDDEPATDDDEPFLDFD